MENINLSTVFSAEQIQDKVKEIGQSLNEKFKGQDSVIVVCVLRGSFIFFSDLVRELDFDVECDFLGLSSYGSKTTSSGEVKLTLDLTESIKDKHVIVVEDIVDTGLTMSHLQDQLNLRGPKSITSVAFLHKPEAKKVNCVIDYFGFKIPNDFVVGYGLDYNGYYRNLPYVAQLQGFN